MKVVATPSNTTITRLVSGVELKLQSTGKHWTLQAKPANNASEKQK
jgi:hypothetical protein